MVFMACRKTNVPNGATIPGKIIAQCVRVILNCSATMKLGTKTACKGMSITTIYTKSRTSLCIHFQQANPYAVSRETIKLPKSTIAVKTAFSRQ